jgi:hypothetical protein
VKLFGPRPRFKCSVSADCFARDHSPLGRLRPRYKPGAARLFPFFLALPVHGFLPTLAVLTSVPGSAPSSRSGVRLVTHGRAPIDFSRCNCGSHSPGLDFHARFSSSLAGSSSPPVRPDPVFHFHRWKVFYFHHPGFIRSPPIFAQASCSWFRFSR